MSETIWGIIITGVITLGASLGSIILANEFNNRRLKAQLDHDRDLTKREREMSLRTEIYLAAAEAVSAGLFAVGQFPYLDVPYEQVLQGYANKAPSVTKVNIIAGVETVRAFVHFSTELTATFLRLALKRGPLVAQKQLIDVLRSRDERAREEAETLNVSLIRQHLEYSDECVAEALKLGRLLVPLLLAARKELELPIDEPEFLRISDEGFTKLVKNHQEFMRHLRAGLPPPAA
jgi:hypothetical protein